MLHRFSYGLDRTWYIVSKHQKSEFKVHLAKYNKNLLLCLIRLQFNYRILAYIVSCIQELIPATVHFEDGLVNIYV